MLEHQKSVLRAIAENPVLFRKELEKSFKWLSNQEVKKLLVWIDTEFNGQYHQLSHHLFLSVAG